MRLRIVLLLISWLLLSPIQAWACAAWPVPPDGRHLFTAQRNGWFIKQYDTIGDGQTDVAHWHRVKLNTETGQVEGSRYPMFFLKDFGPGEKLDDGKGSGYNGWPDAIFINTHKSLDEPPECSEIRLYGREMNAPFNPNLKNVQPHRNSPRPLTYH